MLGLLALVIAAAFAGAAHYIVMAEQPARLLLAAGPALQHWKPAYRRGFAMQATLALVGGLCGFAAFFFEDADWRLLAGALLLLANWPYTVIVILPVNRKLEATDPAQAGDESRALLTRWGRLHAVRDVLGMLATAVLLWAAAT
jgi:uncharacterized membrane protein